MLVQEFQEVAKPKKKTTPTETTKAALKEARAISAGEVPAKSFSSVEELLKEMITDTDE